MKMNMLFTVWVTTQSPSFALIAPGLISPVGNSVSMYQKRNENSACIPEEGRSCSLCEVPSAKDLSHHRL